MGLIDNKKKRANMTMGSSSPSMRVFGKRADKTRTDYLPPIPTQVPSSVHRGLLTLWTPSPRLYQLALVGFNQWRHQQGILGLERREVVFFSPTSVLGITPLGYLWHSLCPSMTPAPLGSLTGSEQWHLPLPCQPKLWFLLWLVSECLNIPHLLPPLR